MHTDEHRSRATRPPFCQPPTAFDVGWGWQIAGLIALAAMIVGTLLLSNGWLE